LGCRVWGGRGALGWHDSRSRLKHVSVVCLPTLLVCPPACYSACPFDLSVPAHPAFRLGARPVVHHSCLSQSIILVGFVCYTFCPSLLFAGYDSGGEGREAGARTAGHRSTLPAHHPISTSSGHYSMLGHQLQLQEHTWIQEQQLLGSRLFRTNGSCAGVIQPIARSGLVSMCWAALPCRVTTAVLLLELLVAAVHLQQGARTFCTSLHGAYSSTARACSA
jgi:hypothetical protein